MSEDEGVTFLICLIIAVLAWGKWLFAVLFRASLGAGPGIRSTFVFVPVACALMLLYILRTFASHDVRDSREYLAMYQIMGAAWVALSAISTEAFGISMRDDGLERSNRAATLVIGASLIAFTLCFAGGNIGDGPGWWVVLFSAMLSTASLLLLWQLIERVTGLSDIITIERNGGDAARFSGFLIAAGLILGRSVAGTWVNTLDTVNDFFSMSWPVLILAFFEMFVGVMRNRDRVSAVRGNPAVSMIIGLAYIAAAVSHVILLGWWS